MAEKNEIKIRLKTFIILVIVFIVIAAGCVFYIAQTVNKVEKANTNTNTNGISEKPNTNTTNNISENSNKTSNESNTVSSGKDVDDYFILYDGYEIKPEAGLQSLSDMKITSDAKTKYNTTYYNYADGKYVGETEGTFGEPTYEGVSIVKNVFRVAISKKYDALPRAAVLLNQLPDELADMADYSSVDIHTIDLNGDGKYENIVCAKLNYAEGEIGDGEPEASSFIALFDSNFSKIADLVTLDDGFWGDIKDEDKKVFLSLNDVDYIDIDNDGILEILIKVPSYDGTSVSILKYDGTKLAGQTDIKASVKP